MKRANKSYTGENVFDAALRRIGWLFDQFHNVAVAFSGGKDSTVALNLTLRVAAERGRLPLRVIFIDQEAEWQTVIGYIRRTMADPRIIPQWLQIPIKIFNATSSTVPWLYCWETGRTWMRDKEPNAIKENVYGTDRFAKLFGAILAHDMPDEPAVHIGGVRCTESPARFLGLTGYETYRGETWGSRLDRHDGPGHYAMYPLYDWSDSDIWKAIHSNGWDYCRLYDLMYAHGVAVKDMRVSNLHHETAVQELFYLQEVEAETWERLTERLYGVNTVGHLQRATFKPKTLPFMFASWEEYFYHLVDKLVADEPTKKIFRTRFKQGSRLYASIPDEFAQMMVSSVMVNDYHGTKWGTFRSAKNRHSINRGKKSVGLWGNRDEHAERTLPEPGSGTAGE